MSTRPYVEPDGWRRLAACLGDAHPEDWEVPAGLRQYGDRSDEHKRALAVCDGCLVKAECLDYAYDVGDHYSILGATTPLQRDAIIKERAA